MNLLHPFTIFPCSSGLSLRVCAGTTGHWSEMHRGAWRGHVSWSGWPEVVSCIEADMVGLVPQVYGMKSVNSSFCFLWYGISLWKYGICLWRSTQMVWISLGINLFTVGVSDILERIHRFPLGLECRCRFVSSEIWCFPFFASNTPLWKHNSARFKIQNRWDWWDGVEFSLKPT